MLTAQVEEDTAYGSELLTAEPVLPARESDSLPLGGAVHAIAAGVTLVAVLRKGAFFRPDQLIFPSLLAGLALIGTRRLLRPTRAVLVALAAFTAWYLIAGLGWGVTSRALVLVASLVGFGAALALGQTVRGAQRHDVHRGLVLLGELVSVTGLAALVLRHEPWALHIQGPWQLAGTLTYANATGILLAVLLPLAMCLPEGRHRRIAVCLLVTALLGTASRAAFIAVAASMFFVPRPQLRTALWPAAAGLVGGGACIATAGRSGVQPLLALAVLAGLALALLSVRGWKGPVLVVASVAAGGLVLSLLQGPLPAVQNRVDAGMNGRPRIWSAALHEVRAEPLRGTGPERDLIAKNKGKPERWIYVHNEYLQIAAGAGLVGLALLGLLGGTLARHSRSRDVVAVAAKAGLVALAVGGIFDFGWHLPAVGITSGWVASLSLGGTQ